nr:hypothetical protein [Brachyspira hyodysenteriae]
MPKGPCAKASCIPFSTPGIYCLGIAPPNISFINSKPPSRGSE